MNIIFKRSHQRKGKDHNGSSIEGRGTELHKYLNNYLQEKEWKIDIGRKISDRKRLFIMECEQVMNHFIPALFYTIRK